MVDIIGPRHLDRYLDRFWSQVEAEFKSMPGGENFDPKGILLPWIECKVATREDRSQVAHPKKESSSWKWTIAKLAVGAGVLALAAEYGLPKLAAKVDGFSFPQVPCADTLFGQGQEVAREALEEMKVNPIFRQFAEGKGGLTQLNDAYQITTIVATHFENIKASAESLKNNAEAQYESFKGAANEQFQSFKASAESLKNDAEAQYESYKGVANEQFESFKASAQSLKNDVEAQYESFKGVANELFESFKASAESLKINVEAQFESLKIVTATKLHTFQEGAGEFYKGLMNESASQTWSRFQTVYNDGVGVASTFVSDAKVAFQSARKAGEFFRNTLSTVYNYGLPVGFGLGSLWVVGAAAPVASTVANGASTTLQGAKILSSGAAAVANGARKVAPNVAQRVRNLAVGTLISMIGFANRLTGAGRRY